MYGCISSKQSTAVEEEDPNVKTTLEAWHQFMLAIADSFHGAPCLSSSATHANTGCSFPVSSPVDVPVVELYAVIEESSSFGFVFVRKLVKVGREEALKQCCTSPDPRLRSEPTICLLMSTVAPITSSCFLSDGPK
ncbi:hypothetical protein B296_00035851 [Ensete ventricosum]|uniref:Uncharacterized protein n=1 Tax=Ensete ventricosum TaxID=4639 RepID=A0A426Y5Y5_ENSVE|nr:hypothetical protein B296_00035851 [Ensete ventricosum]